MGKFKGEILIRMELALESHYVSRSRFLLENFHETV